MSGPDEMPPPHEDEHEALAREHAARVEAARLHHAAEALRLRAERDALRAAAEEYARSHARSGGGDQ